MNAEQALPVLVELTRGGIVESKHRGAIAVCRADGTLVAWAGDPELVTFPRSALKPFQALPVVESGAAERFGFGDAELAVCCGSHNGEPRHCEVVGSMLQRADVPLTAMRNGVTPPIDETEHARYTLDLLDHTPLLQNCSGKHAGILAACRARGYAVEDYDALDHPIQREIRASLGECFRMPGDDLVAGIDGCTLPTYGAPLRNISAGWGAVAAPSKGPSRHAAALGRLARAMAAEPWMVAGTGRIDTNLSQATGGRVLAKGGAEGVICLAIVDRGLGVTVKLDDGTYRGHDAIVPALLRQLDAVSADEAARLDALFPAAIRSNRDQQVGEMTAVFELQFAS